MRSFAVLLACALWWGCGAEDERPGEEEAVEEIGPVGVEEAADFEAIGLRFVNPFASVFDNESRKLLTVLYDARETTRVPSEVVWESSDPQVATVVDGRIAPRSAGMTTIVARVEDLEESLELRVKSTRLHAIEISASALAVDWLGTLPLYAQGYNEEGDELDVEVVWRSLDTELAEVNRFGVVSGHKVGVVTIEAVAGDVVGQASIEVTDPSPRRIIVRPARLLLAPGRTVQLDATAKTASGAPLQAPLIEWSSEDETVAVVDASGWVQAVAPGTTRLIARLDTRTEPVYIEVDEAYARDPYLGPCTVRAYHAPGKSGTWLPYRDEYLYDEQGRQVHYGRDVRSNGTVDITVETTYDEAGRLAQKEEIDRRQSLHVLKDYTYDEAGLLATLRRTWLNADREPYGVLEELFTYDTEGRMRDSILLYNGAPTQRLLYDYDALLGHNTQITTMIGDDFERTSHIYRHTYNYVGDLTAISKQNNLGLGQWSDLHIRYRYDQRGWLIGEEFKGTPCDSTVVDRRHWAHIYDATGNLVRSELGRWQNDPILIFDYDYGCWDE